VAPLVTVGIPTYNRRRLLERAVASALAQTHADIEGSVSDDASPDDSAEAMERLAATEPRLRFTRQPVNLGHAENYDWVLRQARGEYFMWLADDDYLDPEYVERCLAVLRGEPGTVLCCGLARYYVDERHDVDERPIDLTQARPGLRVLRYFARVNMNGPLFGLARREDWMRVGFPDVPAGDWLIVSRMAARGRIRTLPDVHLHRSMTGLGTDPERLARSFGFSGFLARHHHLWVARNLFRELLPEQGPVVAAGAALLVAARFEGAAQARRLPGMAALERRAIAWVRSRPC
jgi:glycosyltransferase involved in cell wall biosynthesis